MLEYLGTIVFVLLPTLWVFGVGFYGFFGGLFLDSFKKLHYPLTIEVSYKAYGYQIFMATVEKPLECLFGPILIASFLRYMADLPMGWVILISIAYPMFLVITLVSLVIQSQDYGEHGQGSKEEISKAQEQWIKFNSKEFKNEWLGKKIPIDIAVEAFQDELIDFKSKDAKGEELTVVETMMHRYELFKFSFTSNTVRSILWDLLCRVYKHDADADKADVSDVYNRGNDFYGWFLCDKMLYSVGLWDSADPTQFDGPSYDNKKMNANMSTAQTKKLDKICNELCMMKEGMEHLDLGCGWGALIMHSTGNYKTKSTGITLSQEQADFIASKDTKKLTDVKVINAWTWLEQCAAEGKKYDVITCLEMSEHIGVRDYQKFNHAVRKVLKDDGIYYLQIAGLRRNWQYEDLMWGMFMMRYVFPGADASCPLYWDIEQLERSGFEIRSVSNEGVHYGLTIYAWYKNWLKNKAVVVKKYGEKSWRNWSIFLSWSYLIAMQGSSTVYMICMTKNYPNDVRSRAALTKEPIKELGMNRAKYWVDKTRDTPSAK